MNYKDLYMTGAGAAMLGAAMIWRPWPFYVAAAIGTMVSDPNGMDHSAGQWRTNELDTLSGELRTLRDQLKEKGKWEGKASEAFDSVYTSYNDSIKQLKEIRDNTADGVGSTANFYKVGAGVCMAIGLGVYAFGLWKMAMRSTPPTALAAEAADAAVGKATLTVIGNVVKKQGMVVIGLGTLLSMAVTQTKMSGKIFPTLEAAIPTNTMSTPNGKMPFTNDGMTYDPNMGALTPKMDESLGAPLGGGNLKI
ncbi:WXG100 family type VII secretion target [Nonomuraea sp. SYSU D8015]|uniref:WXG100 family type VII secretion target n=1 Tax=Nonomuraea sp. SYSU D8015 TaxID=2593644 RepID=UPI0016607FD0|nr:WXG100 family type VII secretion target [Nonomuraea sp. SYSU D8015]